MSKNYFTEPLKDTFIQNVTFYSPEKGQVIKKYQNIKIKLKDPEFTH